MISLKRQEELLLTIGDKLAIKTECFVFGGSAMLYYNAKPATKDIDIVFRSEDDREKVVDILKYVGFRERNPKLLYFKKKNTPILLSRREERFDLFYKKIICFELSETMIKRATKIYEYGNLIAKIISPEDIILLKCATERAGDRIDAKQLIENYNIKWDMIVNEAITQTSLGQTLFVVCLFDFLEEIQSDLKTDIPDTVMNKIQKRAEQGIIKSMKNGTNVTVVKHRKDRIPENM